MFVFALLIATGVSHAQDTIMTVYGAILDITTQTPLTDIEVVAIDVNDTTHQMKAEIRKDGRYMLGLFEERGYMIVFNAEGYVPKMVLVDMNGPSKAQWKEGYGLSVDISLFKDLPGLDLTMNGPIGRSSYNPAADVFEWDSAYTRSIRDRQKEMLKSYKQRLAGKDG